MMYICNTKAVSKATFSILGTCTKKSEIGKHGHFWDYPRRLCVNVFTLMPVISLFMSLQFHGDKLMILCQLDTSKTTILIAGSFPVPTTIPISCCTQS